MKIGHFWRKWSKLAHFGGQNDVIVQNFGKMVKNFNSKRFKNYLILAYRHKYGQKFNKLGQFGQNRSFLVKIVKIG